MTGPSPSGFSLLSCGCLESFKVFPLWVFLGVEAKLLDLSCCVRGVSNIGCVCFFVHSDVHLVWVLLRRSASSTAASSFTLAFFVKKCQ